MSSQRIVIVTGGSQNIGLSIAQKFKQTGATVISADLIRHLMIHSTLF